MIIPGDCLAGLKTLSACSVQCVVTSPPYWALRDYHAEGQFGLEPTPEEYVSNMVILFEEIKRVLRDDGTVWLNLGDTYAAGSMTGRHGPNTKMGKRGGQIDTKLPPRKPPPGLKPLDLVGIPWRVAFGLQAAGWYLRSEIIWEHWRGPESVTNRPTRAHEHIFLLSKDRDYVCNMGAIRDGGHNRTDVWRIPREHFKEAHFATFPQALAEPCVKAGAPYGSLVMDPFSGSGTVGLVAAKLGRKFIGFELNPKYKSIAEHRIFWRTAKIKSYTLKRQKRGVQDAV